MKIKRVFFIYHGSDGIAGGYTAKFVEAISQNADVHVFVNCFYSYPHELKSVNLYRCFFPFSDRLFVKKTFFRKIIRYFELALGYSFVIFMAICYRPELVIYNPITNLKITRNFVWLSKLFSREVWVTIHDAQSHTGKVETYRDQTMMLADGFIFHNQHSQLILQDRFQAQKRFVILPFPWSFHRLNNEVCKKSNAFLFIGYVRPSKGIDYLIEAYKIYKTKGGVFDLVVAGNMDPFYFDLLVNVATKIINKTVDNNEFLRLINESRFVILPYKTGYSNSSVHICATIHCNTPFICSDIDLFSQFKDGIDCIKFDAENVGSLVDAMFVSQNISEKYGGTMALSALNVIQDNMRMFDSEVSDFLTSLSFD